MLPARRPNVRTPLILGLWLAGSAALADTARATPFDYIPVGDPIESELRILDLIDARPLGRRIRLPHLGTRPLQIIELEGLGTPPESLDATRAISVARIERALGRDRAPLFAPHPRHAATPRWLEFGSEAQILEVSGGLEGAGQINKSGSRVASGSGFHGRVALGLDRLLAYSHYIVGRIENARRFADPIIPNSDLIVLTEETYLSYTEARGQWGAQFGRSRWHWGPGEEGSLVLSKTSASLTGLAFRARLAALNADAIALSATVRDAANEQLAAHRIEWQPRDGLRVGVTESARYQAPGWRPLYLVGAIPYVLVQRLEVENEPDSLRAHRNNIITAFDAAWRVAEGTRIYGEILIDDLHAKNARTPNKFAYQVGWEGVGSVFKTRLSWGGEYTRVTRYVYTSFFGRSYVSQGRSLGFPVAPDARRVRLRVAWDPNPDWQLSAHATHLDKGQNDLNEPFLPRSPRVNSSEFEGVIESSRELDGTLRWWPASGVDLSVSGGYGWIDNLNHVRGARHQEANASVSLRLTR